jgi:hypothetical protein
MHGDPDDKGHEFWPKQKNIIKWNAYLSGIANYYSTTQNPPIVKVHLTSPQSERIDLNVYIPSRMGYNRIAHDFFGGLLQAMQRGFLDDPKCQGNENRRIMMSIEAMGVRDLCSREKKGR